MHLEPKLYDRIVLGFEWNPCSPLLRNGGRCS